MSDNKKGRFPHGNNTHKVNSTEQESEWSAAGTDNPELSAAGTDNPDLSAAGKQQGDQPTRDPETVTRVMEPCIRPSKEGESKYSPLAMPMDTRVNYERDLEDLPNLPPNATPQTIAWYESLVAGRGLSFEDEDFENILEDENSDWSQAPTSTAGKKLTIGRIALGKHKGGRSLTGAAAILKAFSMAGGGVPIQFPLWNSGIWVTFKTPTDRSIFELERRIAHEREYIGRNTGGVGISNESVYFDYHVINFILDHVYDTTLKSWSKESLKAIILASDIPQLQWGAICGINPDGHPYSRACSSNVTDCNHVVEAIVKLQKLNWVDRAKLSPEQLLFMSDRSTVRTAEDIENYQSLNTANVKTEVKVSDTVAIDIKTPTIASTFTRSIRYIEDLVDSMERAFTTPLIGDERDQHLKAALDLAPVRKYSNYISKIYVRVDEDDEWSWIETDEDIEEFCGAISSQMELSDAIVAEIKKQAANSTVTVNAIPSYKCPSCGKSNNSIDDPTGKLIPIQIGKTFFTLIQRRVYLSLTKI